MSREGVCSSFNNLYCWGTESQGHTTRAPPLCKHNRRYSRVQTGYRLRQHPLYLPTCLDIAKYI